MMRQRGMHVLALACNGRTVAAGAGTEGKLQHAVSWLTCNLSTRHQHVSATKLPSKEYCPMPILLGTCTQADTG
eukprot:1156723-Pelagomonas_calceolata.AAC.23